MTKTDTTSEFSISGTWVGTMADGRGELGGAGLRVVHSAPQGFGGKGVGTNPEELLVAAAASCALITLSAILGVQGLEPKSSQCQSTARFDEGPSGPKLATIHHDIRLVSDTAKIDPDRIAKMVERSCMVSQALAGNAGVTVQVTVQAAVGAA